MKTTKTLLPIAFLLLTFQLSAWGNKGHYIIAEIAEQNLTPKAKARVDELLKGKKMVYYADWLDYARNDSMYDFTRTWHYANVDSGQTYESMRKVETGDMLTATELTMKILSSPTENDSIKTFYLKVLIHVVGDMHCPMHAGRLSDRGGNQHPIIWFGRETNIHSLWDTHLIESARLWSYSEWAVNLMAGLKPADIAEMQSGTPKEWLLHTVELADYLYKITPQNQDNRYIYIYKYAYILDEQLTGAGYRLAHLINTLFN
jgi:hypothetical protein